MYRTMNTRLVKSQLPVQARLLSTHQQQVRKGGMSKVLLGTLFVTAAGFAYYANTSTTDQRLYEGNSDPYQKTKRSISQTGEEIAHDSDIRSKGRSAANELNAAGQHIKNSAHLAGEAAKDAFGHVEKEGAKAVNNFKDESHKLKENIKYDAEKKKSDISNAAYNAADKFKEAKRDVSNEVDRESQKARQAWEEKKGEAKATAEHAKEEGKSFWSSLFGSSEPKEPVVVDVRKTGKKGDVYDYPKGTHGEHNPMVAEYQTSDNTKPNWEKNLEAHAEHVVRDTSSLVEKDTEKVKKGVWDAKKEANKTGSWFGKASDKASELETKAANELHEVSDEAKSKWETLKNKVGVTTHDVKKDAENSWENVKDQASAEAQRAKRNVNSSVDDLSSKANKEANRLESSWNSTKKQVANNAEYAADNVRKTAEDVKDEGARLTRKASNSIHDLHNEVSSNAEKWKNQTEETAKSWYQKGTEQVKDGLATVKEVADKDLHWAEEKVYGAKEEVERLFGIRNEKAEGIRGHTFRGERFAENEAGNLRSTRSSVNKKPADVIVEEAHSKEM